MIQICCVWSTFTWVIALCNNSVFRIFLGRPLRYWLENWYMTLSLHDTDQVRLLWRLTYFLYARLQTGRIMVWWCPSVRPGLRPSVRHSFPHFSPTCFEILYWNFVYNFISMHVRSSSNVIIFRQFLHELWPLLNFKPLQICSFPHFFPTCFDILS